MARPCATVPPAWRAFVRGIRRLHKNARQADARPSAACVESLPDPVDVNCLVRAWARAEPPPPCNGSLAEFSHAQLVTLIYRGLWA
jgi:hypothetical protein